jgi:2EXR family
MANISIVGQIPSLSNTFTLLPELAVELKLKIWEYTFPKPRTIIIKQKSGPHWDSNIHKIIHFSFGTCDESPKLILLRVNREAREFTQEKYQRCFLTVCGSSKYFKYERDVLKIELIDWHTSQRQYEIPNL